MTRETYLQGPGLAVAISGTPIARRYFRREYGAALATAGAATPELDVSFARASGSQAGTLVEGRHKLARWSVRVLADPDAPVALRAHVQGPFGLPLVQSLLVEPLIGVAASRAGLALVPGALLLDAEGRGVLLVGGSGAGKTSLAARAIAAGSAVLADDRVFVDADATAWRFERRMRLYPDIAQTAPAAWEALAPAARARLRAVAMLRELSRGRFAPPVAVARRELGVGRPPVSGSISRILLLRRHDGSTAASGALPDAAAVDEIEQRIGDDRAALAGPGLGNQLRGLAAEDRAVLEPAVRAATVERIEIPLTWPAARSVARLAAELGLA